MCKKGQEQHHSVLALSWAAYRLMVTARFNLDHSARTVQNTCGWSSIFHVMSLGRTHILAQCRSIQQSRHPDKMPKCSIGQFFFPTVSVSSTEIPAQCRSDFCSYSCLPLALCVDRAQQNEFHACISFVLVLGFAECSLFLCFLLKST